MKQISRNARQMFETTVGKAELHHDHCMMFWKGVNSLTPCEHLTPFFEKRVGFSNWYWHERANPIAQNVYLPE
jgi:hypothetical protein